MALQLTCDGGALIWRAGVAKPECVVNIRVRVSLLHDINLPRIAPGTVLVGIRKHPKRGPGPLLSGQQQTCLNVYCTNSGVRSVGVNKRLLPLRVDSCAGPITGRHWHLGREMFSNLRIHHHHDSSTLDELSHLSSSQKRRRAQRPRSKRCRRCGTKSCNGNARAGGHAPPGPASRAARK